MPNTKISAMPVATLPLVGTETVPLVQSGNNVKASVFNVKAATYGEIYVASGAVAQSLAVANTFYKVTAFTTDGLANGVTPQVANDRIRIDTTGVYQVQFFLTFTDSNNRTFSFRIFNETTATAYPNTLVKNHSHSTDPMFVAASAFVSASANDTLIVQAACNTDATNITVSDGNLAVMLLRAS